MTIFRFLHVIAGMHAKSLQSCLTLCDPMDCTPPGFSVHGILQARILEWLAVPSSRGSSQPRDQSCISYVSCFGRGFFIGPSRKPACCCKRHYLILLSDKYSILCVCVCVCVYVKLKVAQSCLALCDPMDYTVHGILWDRILEWIDFPFSRTSSQPRD